jgi:hypothetical protein
MFSRFGCFSGGMRLKQTGRDGLTNGSAGMFMPALLKIVRVCGGLNMVLCLRRGRFGGRILRLLRLWQIAQILGACRLTQNCRFLPKLNGSGVVNKTRSFKNFFQLRDKKSRQSYAGIFITSG